MAKKWSSFVPQNLSAKEEWDLLEACEAHASMKEDMRASENEEDCRELAVSREPNGRITIRLLKPKKSALTGSARSRYCSGACPNRGRSEKSGRFSG